MRLLIAFALVAALCSCDGPRGSIMPRADASRDQRVMRLKVLQVFDNAKSDYTTEFRVWHVIEVEVLDGPPGLVGQILDLPYDDFFVAQAPPLPGDVVTTSPADWVNQREPGKTRGFGQ
jgi:hypothetical protein